MKPRAKKSRNSQVVTWTSNGAASKSETGSRKHSLYTHFPKDPNCQICLKTKITRASCRRRADAVMPRAEHPGELITADHQVLIEDNESRNNNGYAGVVQVLATQWIQSYPCKSKSSQETKKNMMRFLEPTRKPRVMYTDNFRGIWQVLRRIILESLYVNTAKIRNTWDC